MKTRSLVIAAVAGTLTVGGVAAPAYAITPATITIGGGTLGITAPTGSVSLGSQANIVAGGSISGPLGQVQVTDARDTTPTWVASVIATAFTPTAGPAIPASAVSYAAGTITQVGTATYTAINPSNLTGVEPVVTAAGITSGNSATWNPTITVAVPAGMAVGTYSATITHSVA